MIILQRGAKWKRLRREQEHSDIDMTRMTFENIAKSPRAKTSCVVGIVVVDS